MHPALGWSLAFLCLVAGWVGGGWQGVLLALTVIVFWLLLGFNRSLRVMRNAAQSPVGLVDNAVMLQSRLAAGMTMMKIVTLTHSLGRRVGTEPEVWRWHDAAGDAVSIEFEAGRARRWVLERALAPAEDSVV